MMLMPSADSSGLLHYLVGRYPGKLGWLIGPSNMRVRPWLPFAMDNDAFAAWKNGTPWNYDAWLRMIEWAIKLRRKPLWALIPDVVINREATLENWHVYSPLIKSIGWPTAFAVQDGMMASDVPPEADVVFVGGSFDWKWNTLEMWASSFPRVHVGRVNSVKRARLCESLGVESIDGTGWFRCESRKDQSITEWLGHTFNADDNLSKASVGPSRGETYEPEEYFRRATP